MSGLDDARDALERLSAACERAHALRSRMLTVVEESMRTAEMATVDTSEPTSGASAVLAEMSLDMALMLATIGTLDQDIKGCGLLVRVLEGAFADAPRSEPDPGVISEARRRAAALNESIAVVDAARSGVEASLDSLRRSLKASAR